MFHLNKAGLKDQIFNLHAADAAFPEANGASIFYKQHDPKVEITIEMVREPSDGYWENAWRKKPWCTCYWSGRPTADWIFSTAYAADANLNDTFWKQERFNKLLIQARADLDEQKRHELYVECQRIVQD